MDKLIHKQIRDEEYANKSMNKRKMAKYKKAEKNKNQRKDEKGRRNG